MTMNKAVLPPPSNERSEKFDILEKSWNPNVSIRPEQKRIVQMSRDIKHFIVKSLSDPEENRKVIEKSNRVRERSMDSFDKLSWTLGFTHHDGTDKNLELKVIKVIMVREGLLMSLKHLVDTAYRTGTLNGTNILELLAQLREKTLNYLEALCLWRQSAQEVSNLGGESNDAAPQLRIFVWEHQNYTIKLVNDMDFLADSPTVIDTLKIPPEQLRANPLMLSNNLEDINTWMDPYDRAVNDMNGVTIGTEFETRLRLRFAERILLQELENNNASNSQAFFVTQSNEANQPPMPAPNMNAGGGYPYHNSGYDPDELMIGSNALEDDYESNGSGRGMESVKGQNYYNPSPNYQEAPRRIYPFDRATSNDSNLSQKPAYDANSRSSSGYDFAPLQYDEQYQQYDPYQQNAPLRQSFNNPLSSNPDPFSTTYNQYGHEFFAGAWNEDSRTSTGPPPNEAQVYPGGGGDGLFDGGAVQPNPNTAVKTGTDSQYNIPSHHGYRVYGYAPSIVTTNSSSVNDGVGSSSVRSYRSLETIADSEIKALLSIKVPPKTAVLTGSVIIVLLSRDNKIPIDLSWKAFVRMIKTENVSEMMNTLDPDHVPGFKIIAIQPMLDELVEEKLISSDMQGIGTGELPMSGLMAMNKLVKWAKQFTLQALKKHRKFGPKSPLRLSNPNFVPLPPHYLEANKNSNNNSNKGGDANSSPSPTNRKVRELSPLRIDSADSDRRSKKSSKKANKFALLRQSKKVIVPKVNLDLVTVHTELLENVPTNHPVILVILTSPPEDGEAKKSLRSTATASTASLPSVEDSSTLRIVLKVYDTVSSEEHLLHINIREYTLFLEDYVQVVGERARLVFDPSDLQWWVQHASKILVVQERTNGKLHASLSKKLLTDLLGHLLALEHQHEHPHSPKPPAVASNSAVASSSRGPSPKKTKTKKKSDTTKPKNKATTASRSRREPSPAPSAAKKPPASQPVTSKTATPAPVASLPRSSSSPPTASSRLAAKRSTSPAIPIARTTSNASMEPVSLGATPSEKRQSMPNVKIHDYKLLPRSSSNDEQQRRQSPPTQPQPEKQPSVPRSSSSSAIRGSTPKASSAPSTPKPAVINNSGIANRSKSSDMAVVTSSPSLLPEAVSEQPQPTASASITEVKESSISSNHYEDDFLDNKEEEEEEVAIEEIPVEEEKRAEKRVPPVDPTVEDQSSLLEDYDEHHQLQEYLQDSPSRTQPPLRASEATSSSIPPEQSKKTSDSEIGEEPSSSLLLENSQSDNQSEQRYEEFFSTIDQRKRALSQRGIAFTSSTKTAEDLTGQEPSQLEDKTEPVPQQQISGNSGEVEEEVAEEVREGPSLATTSKEVPPIASSVNAESSDNIYEEADEDFEQPNTSIVDEAEERLAAADTFRLAALNGTSQSITSQNPYDEDFESMNNSLTRSQVVPAPSGTSKENSSESRRGAETEAEGDKQQKNEEEKEENPSYYSEFDQDEEDLYNIDD